MNPDISVALPCKVLVEQLLARQAELRARGIVALSVFGSRARGDNRADSDLDLLIDFDRSRKFSLVDLVNAEHEIEQMTGLAVQITTLSSVPTASRARLLADAVQVF